MASETKTVETVVHFIPGGYGTAFEVFMGIFDFAHSFGKTDPLDYAVARLQKQIDALVAEIAKVKDRLNQHARRIAKIENDRHVDKLLELNREAARIALRIAQGPTDAKERELLAFDARVLADRFLLEPDIWQWTDLEVKRLFDDYGQFTEEQIRLLDPDFKAHLALPSYTYAVLLLLAAIFLDTLGEPEQVRQRYSQPLGRHIAAVSSRPGWNDPGDPPETLAEMIRARITCYPVAENKYAAAGQCVFGIVCENVMERQTTAVRDTTLTLADRGPTVFCTAPADIGRFDEEEIEGQKGVMLLTELGQMMRQVLAHGSLVEPFIGNFAMAPTLPLAVLYGIRHDGVADWYRQIPGEGPNAASQWLGPRRTRDGWENYARIFPAGGNRLYGLHRNGELHWFAHDDFNDGGPGWAGFKRVGRGWGSFLSITPGGDGVLYAVQPDGKLLWYRHDGLTSGGGIETWRSASVHSGFHEYRRLFSVNEGVLYAVASDGTLMWFRHKGFKDGTSLWDGPRKVGKGWQNFRDVFGTDNGVVYAQRPNGTLLRYVHLAWETGGDESTWRPPVPVSFGVGGYRQVVTLMSASLPPVRLAREGRQIRWRTAAPQRLDARGHNGAMTDLRPFRIAVPDDDLADLRRRLAATRWPEAECVDDWSQGIPLSYTRELAAYWADGYDWRARESALNRFDQFTTEIDGLDIHFIHQRSPHADAFPLIITHGWPGSVVEFQKIIEPLTDPTAHGGRAEDAFHVVCPSLPGYGFSGQPSTTGWNVGKIAQAWETLMVRLGYERYGAQGGDWGAAVTTEMGRNRGHCVAIHTNMPIALPPADALDNPTDEDQRALAALAHYRRWDSGYAKQQSTRPQTLGYGLVDSPAAQMAWIIEKFWSWTDCDGHPENALSRDELLDNVTVYWVTGTGASSARLYWESMGAWRPADRVEVPTGVAAFPKEILRSPRHWCEANYRITRWTTMPRGGHFAAFEQPDLFVDDVRAFFATVR